jgi:hypothetical protein
VVVMQVDNFQHWMCPIIFWDTVTWNKHPSFCISYLIDTKLELGFISGSPFLFEAILQINICSKRLRHLPPLLL